jgi:hypothetical protein
MHSSFAGRLSCQGSPQSKWQACGRAQHREDKFFHQKCENLDFNKFLLIQPQFLPGVVFRLAELKNDLYLSSPCRY